MVQVGPPEERGGFGDGKGGALFKGDFQPSDGWGKLGHRVEQPPVVRGVDPQHQAVEGRGARQHPGHNPQRPGLVIPEELQPRNRPFQRVQPPHDDARLQGGPFHPQQGVPHGGDGAQREVGEAGCVDGEPGKLDVGVGVYVERPDERGPGGGRGDGEGDDGGVQPGLHEAKLGERGPRDVPLDQVGDPHQTVIADHPEHLEIGDRIPPSPLLGGKGGQGPARPPGRGFPRRGRCGRSDGGGGRPPPGNEGTGCRRWAAAP